MVKASGNMDIHRLLYQPQMPRMELEVEERDLGDVPQSLECVGNLYAALYDYAPVGYLTFNKIGRITNANLTASRMLGRERSQLIGRTLPFVFGSPEHSVLVNHLRMAFLAEGPVTGNLDHWLEHDGLTHSYRLDSRVRTDSNGEKCCLTTLVDITETKELEESLRQERNFLRHVIDGIVDPILVINTSHEVTLANRVAKELREKSGSVFDHLIDRERVGESNRPRSGDDCPGRLQTLLSTGVPCRFEDRHQAANGQVRRYEVSASFMFDDDGQVTNLIELARDITEQMNLLNEVKARELSYVHLAQHDSLTGLPNRLLFADRLSQAIRLAHRNHSRFAVLFIDLDRFKQVNDCFDHGHGDEVLKVVAARFQTLFRENDTIARMGGDEFIVILPDIKHRAAAASIAIKVLNVFKNPFEVCGKQLTLGASIGISLYPEHGATVDDLVRSADTAMYRAKEEGRNTFRYYTQELTDRALERISLESDLHRAIEKGEFVLAYQPQVDLLGGDVCGLEALVRWRHPELGLIFPERFIPLAEDTGIINRLGEWILREACRQMKLWQGTGVMPDDAQISVNLSAKQCDQNDLIEMIQRILRETGLDPRSLELDITESIMMREPDLSAFVLKQVRDLGVNCAVDDFGTGYSSLNYLKRLPITRLKIDRSFVTDVPAGVDGAVIIKAIVGLASSLSLDVLAEGIETREQRAFLIQEGCRIGQGYLLDRPVTASEYETAHRAD